VPFPHLFRSLRGGCFGKIPSFSEHVNVPLGESTAERVRAWVDEIAVVLESAASPRYPTPYRFLYRLPADPLVAVGWLWDSHDRQGRRKPFALYTEVTSRLLRAPLHALPILADHLWQALRHGVFTDADPWTVDPAPTEQDGAMQVNAIKEQITSLRIARPRLKGEDAFVLKALGNKRRDQWLENLFPLGDPVRAFALAAAHLAAVCAGPADGAAAHLPATPREPLLLQTAFWLGITEGLGLAEERLPPTVIIPEEEVRHAATITVALRPLKGVDAGRMFQVDFDEARRDNEIVHRCADVIGREVAACASPADILAIPFGTCYRQAVAGEDLAHTGGDDG
jgi:hypothetical protein